MFDTSFGFLVAFEIILCSMLIYKYQVYKSTSIIFVFLLVNSFVSPCLYFMCGGTSYSIISSATFEEYCWLSLFFIIVLCIQIFWVFENNISLVKISRIKVFNSNIIPSIILLFSVVTICFWAIMYSDRLPLLQLLLYSISEPVIKRPDIAGTIPHFFTLDTIIMVMVPMLFCFFYDRIKCVQKYKFIYVSMVIFFLMLGGNKGIAVYFVIFIWIYVLQYKINLKLLTIIFCIFIGYMVINNANSVAVVDLCYGVIDALRRFFVTQGAMLVNRIELLNQGYDLDINTVNKVVMQYVYGHSYGSAPTIFIGNLIVGVGYKIGIFLSVCIMFVVIGLSNSIDNYVKNNDKSLYLCWSLFFCWWLLGNGGIEYSFLIRLFIILFYTIVFWSIDMNLKNQGS